MGEKEESRKIAWVSWRKVRMPKKRSVGGLGIKDSEVFNRALLGK